MNTIVLKHILARIMNFLGPQSSWSGCRPVTAESTGSSPVGPAINIGLWCNGSITVSKTVGGGSSHSRPAIWASMYQGGESPLQGDCGEFDSHLVHKSPKQQEPSIKWKKMDNKRLLNTYEVI